MSNPYLPPTQPGEYRPVGASYLPSTRAEDYRPEGKSFTRLQVILALVAAVVVLAVLALLLREVTDWLGAVLVPLICLVLIGLMELGRLLFPPKQYYLPPLPANPMQTAYFGVGESPFAPSGNYFAENAVNPPPAPQPPDSSPLIP